MSSINLKKISNKKELRSLIEELVAALNIAIAIEDEKGEILIEIGEQISNHRHPIKVSERIMGWVIGEEKSVLVATFISSFAKQEIEKKELARELLERYQEIDLFEDISTQLTTSLDTHQIAQLVLQKIHQLIDSSAGAIVLLKPLAITPGTPKLEIIAEFGQFFQNPSQLELEQNIIGSILKSGRSELINDVQEDVRSPEPTNIRSLVGAPLRAKERVLGVIAIGAQEPDKYTTEHLKLINIFSSQTAVAIEKALLYEQSCHSAAQAKAQAMELKQALRDLQLAQTQLIQSEKMSSLGQLIAGVAHEINNPVNFIHGNVKYVSEYAINLMALLQSYQKSFPVTPPELQSQISEIDLEFLMQDLPNLLQSMKLGTNRIVEIVQSLKNFSRLDESGMKTVNIHEGIDITLMILRHRLKETIHRSEIKIIQDYGELPPVECYPGQLNQVFMNILANAIDAIEENLEIQNSDNLQRKSAELFPPTIRIQTEVLDHESVVVRISDNGSGMPEDVVQRIYDPFFTTKDIGKGTGLGMAISYQLIVERHRGILKCHSRPGEGTEFWIQIPISASDSDHADDQVSKLDDCNALPCEDMSIQQSSLNSSSDRLAVSASSTLQRSDLLVQHIHLIQRLTRHCPEIENLPPTNIYRIFQHHPISLKLYTTLLSQFYCLNSSAPIN